MNTNLLGAWGEELAVKYLQKKHYRILTMGYRTRFGEIDIIAVNKSYIIFVEVKLRKNNQYASACEFVDARKQMKLRKTAQLWIAENESAKQPRFDVIEIYAPAGLETKKPEIFHIENAF